MKRTTLVILVISLAVMLTAGAASALTGKRQGPPEFVNDLPESKLTKIVFIRYAEGYARPGAECGNGVCEPGENAKKCPNDCEDGGEEPSQETTCYRFLSGAKPKWNQPEGYRYDDKDLGAVSAWATEIWNDATFGTIFGVGTEGAGAWGLYDYKNSIVYGDYPEAGVIGVTAIWFQAKKIYEYDIMFDTDYFPKDIAIDLDTVVLHEFGHGAGLNDLYTADCASEVMYGYYDGIDLNLGSGDVVGIQTLYGI